MSVFRIHKNTNYTVVSNIHIFDKNLHNKAKGLLTTMLALPENWNFNIKGLAAISADGVDSIAAQLKELENNGYIVRTKIKDAHGHFVDVDYDIYEVPENKTANDFAGIQELIDVEFNSTKKKQNNNKRSESLENTGLSPKRDFPVLENPDTGNPDTENPRQSNTIQSSTNILINQSMPEQVIKQKIEYENLIIEHPEDQEVIDGMVGLIAYANTTNKAQLRVAGENRSIQEIRCQLEKLKKRHIEYVLECLKKSAKPVHSPDAYLLTALYKAPNTIGVYKCAKEPEERSRGEPDKYQNRFNNFHQRDVNIDELEAQLLTNKCDEVRHI